MSQRDKVVQRGVKGGHPLNLVGRKKVGKIRTREERLEGGITRSGRNGEITFLKKINKGLKI